MSLTIRTEAPTDIPAFYSRFGFVVRPGLALPGLAAEYFQALSFSGEWPEGDVSHHLVFEATA